MQRPLALALLGGCVLLLGLLDANVRLAVALIVAAYVANVCRVNLTAGAVGSWLIERLPAPAAGYAGRWASQ